MSGKLGVIKVRRDREGDWDGWVATSEDIHGIVLAGETLDELYSKLTACVPVMLASNFQESEWDGFVMAVPGLHT
jgi:hypothetical protein